MVDLEQVSTGCETLQESLNVALRRKLDPVDTGRKLNVLCTFNLRPVSTGEYASM